MDNITFVFFFVFFDDPLAGFKPIDARRKLDLKQKQAYRLNPSQIPGNISICFKVNQSMSKSIFQLRKGVGGDMRLEDGRPVCEQRLYYDK